MKHLFILIFGSLTVSASNVSATDLRDCPIGHVVFASTSTGDTFTPKAVGYNFDYRCASGWSKLPISNEECSRFGQWVLEGVFEDKLANAVSTKYAIYERGASAPCCGWIFGSANDEFIPDAIKSAHFVARSESMPLSELGVFEIEAEDLIASMNAVACISE